MKKMTTTTVTLLGFLLALLMGWFIYQHWKYQHSAQGKLDKLVQSNQTSFQLSQILGDNWESACLIPSGYWLSLTTDGQSELLPWLEKMLNRDVRPEEYDFMFGEGLANLILFSNPFRESEGLHVEPWQNRKQGLVICTHKPNQTLQIIKNKEGYQEYEWKGYWLKHQFENMYELK